MSALTRGQIGFGVRIEHIPVVSDAGDGGNAVKRLDVAGVVTRTRDPADERRVLVELTPRGRALEAGIRGVAGKVRSACQLTDRSLDDLRLTLEGLARYTFE